MHDNTTNNPPLTADDYRLPFDTLQLSLDDFEGLEIDGDSAAELNDLIKAIKSKAKEADGNRTALKKPHMDASKEIQTSFNVVRDRAAGMEKTAKSYLTVYLVEQQRIAQEAERIAREEAERKAAIAKALKDDAFISQSVAQDAQDAKQAAALKAVESDNAGRAGSASGMARAASLRTYYDAQVVDYKAAALHYASHPDIVAVIVRLAEAAMRGDKSKSTLIPGVAFNIRKEVA